MSRYLKVTYDVTGLTDDQVGQLALEAAVQAEESEHHPAVPAPESYTYDDDDPTTE